MKKITKISLATALVGLMAFTACKKYEEGPSLSIRSKKARLANTWTIEKVTQNGSDVTSLANAAAPKWELTKDGKYTYSGVYMGTPYSETGTWEFITDKEDLKMLSDKSGSTPDTLTITMLKNKEFWWKPKTNPQNEEWHLKGE